MAEKAKPKRRRTLTSTRVDPTMPASVIINDKLGGLANVSQLSGIPTSTIWGWLEIGYIPIKRIPEIKAVAKTLRVKLLDSDFIGGTK